MRTMMWLLLALSMAAAMGALGYRMAERDNWFDLAEARVRGIRAADSSYVAGALRPYFGTPLGSLDMQAIRGDLEALPLVDSVQVRRAWPRSLIVQVGLASPVAVLQSPSGSVNAVDGEGRALPATFLTDTLPVVALREGYSRQDLLVLLEYMRDRGVPAGVRNMELESRGISFLTEDCRVLLGSSKLPVRWRLFMSIPPGAILTGGGCTVDMRFSGQAVVRPEGGTSSG